MASLRTTENNVGDDAARIRQVIKDSELPLSRWILYAIVGYFPACLGLIALIGLAWDYLTSPETSVLSSWPKVPGLVTKAIPFFALFIVIELLISIFITRKSRQTQLKFKTAGNEYYRLNDSVNSIFMGVFQQTIGVFVKGLTVFPYLYIQQHFHYTRFLPSSWSTSQDIDQDVNKNSWNVHNDVDWTHPSWWMMFLIVEFGYYWIHRFAHEWNAHWLGHAPHHSSEEYNLTTALRQGSIQQMFGWLFYLSAAPFFPLSLFLFHAECNTLYQFWIHTRLIGKFPKPIEFIFNTPSHHRVHHGRNPQYIDKNYGGTLIIFDRLFGTFIEEGEEVAYGISHSLNTWNPLYCQFHQLIEMFQVAAKMPNLWEKLRVFINRGPGFNYFVLYPEKVKNPEKVTPTSRPKHDNTMPNLVMSLYGFVHATLLVVFTFLLLTVGGEIGGNILRRFLLKASFAFFNIFGLCTISALFDGTQWAKSLETFRLAVLFPVYAVSIVGLNSNLTIFNPIISSMVGCVVLSLSLLYWKYETRPINHVIKQE